MEQERVLLEEERQKSCNKNIIITILCTVLVFLVVGMFIYAMRGRGLGWFRVPMTNTGENEDEESKKKTFDGVEESTTPNATNTWNNMESIDKQLRTDLTEKKILSMKARLPDNYDEYDKEAREKDLATFDALGAPLAMQVASSYPTYIPPQGPLPRIFQPNVTRMLPFGKSILDDDHSLYVYEKSTGGTGTPIAYALSTS
jgi:flagellar basal body-associated protein FliL